MPGFWILNLLIGQRIGGYADPVYFTATAMIGIIALSGSPRATPSCWSSSWRAEQGGQAPGQSLIEAGALRTRAILLTSLAPC